MLISKMILKIYFIKLKIIMNTKLIESIVDCCVISTSRRNYETPEKMFTDLKWCLEKYKDFDGYLRTPITSWRTSRMHPLCVHPEVIYRFGFVWCYFCKEFLVKCDLDFLEKCFEKSKKKKINVNESREYITDNVGSVNIYNFIVNCKDDFVEILKTLPIFYLINKVYHFLMYFDLCDEWEEVKDGVIKDSVDIYFEDCNIEEYSSSIVHNVCDCEDYLLEMQMLNYICDYDVDIKRKIYPEIAERYNVEYIDDEYESDKDCVCLGYDQAYF